MYPRLAFNSIQRWGWPWTSGHFLKAENISVCLHTWIMLGVESEGFMHTRRACLCLSVCLAICLSIYLPIHSAAYLKDATNSFAKKVYSPFCPFKTRKTNLFLCTPVLLCTPVPSSPLGVLSLSRLKAAKSEQCLKRMLEMWSRGAGNRNVGVFTSSYSAEMGQSQACGTFFRVDVIDRCPCWWMVVFLACPCHPSRRALVHYFW